MKVELSPSCLAAHVENEHGENILFRHLVGGDLERHIREHQVHSLLIEPEDGFSMLGKARSFLSWELGYPERDLKKWVKEGMSGDLQPSISALADWSRETDPDVTLVGIPCLRQEGGRIKGMVLVPYEGSRSYRQFALPSFNKPYRDYFYNVTYEALFYSYHVLGARSFIVSHLSSVKYKLEGGYRADITTSQVQACLHFCDSHREIRSVNFWDLSEGNSPLLSAQKLACSGSLGAHRSIEKSVERKHGIDFVSIQLSVPLGHRLPR